MSDDKYLPRVHISYYYHHHDVVKQCNFPRTALTDSRSFVMFVLA